MKARRLCAWAVLAAAAFAAPAWGQETLEAWPRDRLAGDADRDGITDGSVTPSRRAERTWRWS
jgi:hypothetical protein